MDEITKEQTNFVIEKLSVLKSDSEIRNEFREKYNGKHLTIDTLNRIKDVYKDDLKEMVVKELNNPSAVPIAHSRVRLEVIQKGLEKALEIKGRRSYAVTDPLSGQTSYKEIEDIDHTNILKYLELAAKEEFLAKKLLLEKLSRNVKEKDMPTSGIPIVTILSGYDDEEEEQVDD